MSGSPKYTTVSFEQQRRAQLEALRGSARPNGRPGWRRPGGSG